MTTTSLIGQNRVRIKEFVHFLWNKPEGLPRIMTGQPLTGQVYRGKELPEDIIATYRFRISESGNKIVILSNDPLYTSDYSSSLDFLVYDIESKTTLKTSIPMDIKLGEKSEIVDFLLTKDNNLCLLEHLLTKQRTIINRLRYIAVGGEIIWETRAIDNNRQKGSLFGKCKALLKEIKNIIFLQTETSDTTFIFKIDPNSGKTEEWLSINNIINKIFIDDNLNIHYITFIKEANNRAYISYVPNKEKKEIRYAGAEVYPLLAFPVASDAYNNIYCAEGLSFSCLSPELSLKWKFFTNNMVLDSGHLFTSHFNEEGKNLVIYEWQTNGSMARTINLPLDFPGLRLAKLSGLINSRDFVIEAYQEEDQIFWKYNTTTKILDRLPETSNVDMFHLQEAATWQVDKTGNLFIPVSSAEGFYIVKVSILM